jgi:hypothetical protein
MLVAPNHPHRLGEIARTVFEKRYKGRLNLRRWGELGILGHQLDVPGDPIRGEFFSHLFFDEEFAAALIQQGREDACRWLAQAARGEHDDGLWRRRLDPPRS